MDKSTQKRRKYNQDVLDWLEIKHEVTRDFIRMSLRGDRHSEKSSAIIKDYRSKCNELKKIFPKK